ncbi:MAG: hypothetical protein L3I99_07630 [Sulfurimonas sp.]|nr:hypothetical protein [Sulfurimonas sp.]
MLEDKFNKITSFLLGASWAIVFFGAIITFKTFLFLGLAVTIFLTLLFIIISLFMILVLDAFAVNREKLQEVKKQTKLLEDIYARRN